MAGTSENNRVVDACEKYWEDYKDDCSGFVKAVAADVGVRLMGLQANDIVDEMLSSIWWRKLEDGSDANRWAGDGFFVLAGLKKDPNGHVVVIVPGALSGGKYPTGYWGSLGGVGKKAQTINWSWNTTDRDKVKYACALVPPSITITLERG